MYENIIILTGAGASAESGIKTFRASDGLWEDHRIEDVATPEGFARDPQLVHRFYNLRRQQLLSGEIHPNAAHIALAKLEKEHPGNVLLITQNIDNLHERAGSETLIHMHGELLKMFCINSRQVYAVNEDICVEDKCQCCGLEGTLRPDVVWFGEMPYAMDRIYEELSRCDLFMAIGTSGNVYPAAGFVAAANEAGAMTIEFNLEPSLVDTHFDEGIYGSAGDTVPRFIEKVLNSSNK